METIGVEAGKSIRMIAIYARVSTAKQEEDGTIETQLESVREYAKDHGYTIVKEYLDDGWSGDVLVRPALDELRQDAKKGLWDAVLCYDPDRLARRYSYQALVMEELIAAEIEVIFVTVSSPKNNEEKIFHGFRGLFAEYERAKIIERFRLGKLRAIKEGHIIASRPLFGYNRIPNQKLPNQEKVHGRYEINEEEAVTVRKIFTWIGDEGLTIRQVVRRLQELRITPRQSKRGVWSTSTLTTMLRNEGYIGRAHWYSSVSVEPKNPISKEKYRRIKKSSTKRRPKSEWMYVSVPAIIDEDLFNRARTRLAENARLNPRSKKYEYLLGGKVECICGCKRTGAARQKGKHLYYDCADKVYCFPLPRNCYEHPINARVADKLVWSKIVELMSSPGLLVKQIERWIKNRQNKSSVSIGDTEAMGKRITKLREKEERYTKAYGAGLLTMEKLKEYAVPLREEVTSLELQISRAQKELRQIDLQASPSEEEIATFVETAQKILHDLSFEQKREIVLNTVEKIVGTQEKLHVSGFISVTTHGWYKTKDRHHWITERWEVHAF